MSVVDEQEIYETSWNITKGINSYKEKLTKLNTNINNAIKSCNSLNEENGKEIEGKKEIKIENEKTYIIQEYQKVSIKNEPITKLRQLKKEVEDAITEIEEFRKYAEKSEEIAEIIERIRKKIEKELENQTTKKAKEINKKIEDAYENGNPLGYNWKDRITDLDELNNSDKKNTTCINTVALILNKQGILKKGQWVGNRKDKNGNLYTGYSDEDAKERINKNFKQVNMGGKNASYLTKNGELQKGDIVFWNTEHTNIYAGKDKNGKDIWIDSGRSSPGYNNNNDEFNSIGPFTTEQFIEKRNNTPDNQKRDFDIEKTGIRGVLRPNT